MLRRVQLSSGTAAERIEPHLFVSIKKTLAIAWNDCLYLPRLTLVEPQELLEGCKR